MPDLTLSSAMDTFLSQTSPSIAAVGISDSTSAGRTLLTAANAAAQITALGAETPAGAAAQIAAISAAAIMSKVGEKLVASLQVTWQANAGTAHFATYRATSGTFTVKTSTGYARLINADGSLGSPVGTGAAGSNITLTIPASGLHRALGVLSVAALPGGGAGSTQSGSITTLDFYGNNLTTFSGTALSSLTTLSLSNNNLTTFSGTGLSALTELILGNNNLTTFSNTGGLSALINLGLEDNNLTTFSGTGLSALINLYLDNNNLTTFAGTGLSALNNLYLSSNNLTTFAGTGLSSLISLNLSSNNLTTFAGTGLSSLISLNLANNNLTSIDGAGMMLSYNYSQSGSHPAGSEFQYNSLSASALNSFFTTLGNASGFLDVSNNPGSATCNPTLATAKGYTVLTVHL